MGRRRSSSSSPTDAEPGRQRASDRDRRIEHGAPQLAVRLLAPVFVTATVALFSSGIAMGFLHEHALAVARRLHGPASVVWLILFGLHALVYLRQALTGSRRELVGKPPSVAGRRARSWLLAAAAVCGVVVGAATVPAQHRWVDLRRDHREDRRSYSNRPISTASQSSPLARR